MFLDILGATTLSLNSNTILEEDEEVISNSSGDENTKFVKLSNEMAKQAKRYSLFKFINILFYSDIFILVIFSDQSLDEDY